MIQVPRQTMVAADHRLDAELWKTVSRVHIAFTGDICQDNVAVVEEHLRKVALRPHDFAGTIINCVANEDPDRTTAGIEDPRNRQRIKPRKLQRV